MLFWGKGIAIAGLVLCLLFPIVSRAENIGQEELEGELFLANVLRA